MKGKKVTFTHKVFKANKRDFDLVPIVREFFDTPLSPADIQISYYRNHYGMLGIESIEEIEDESRNQI